VTDEADMHALTRAPDTDDGGIDASALVPDIEAEDVSEGGRRRSDSREVDGRLMRAEVTGKARVWRAGAGSAGRAGEKRIPAGWRLNGRQVIAAVVRSLGRGPILCVPPVGRFPGGGYSQLQARRVR